MPKVADATDLWPSRSENMELATLKNKLAVSCMHVAPPSVLQSGEGQLYYAYAPHIYTARVLHVCCM